MAKYSKYLLRCILLLIFFIIEFIIYLQFWGKVFDFPPNIIFSFLCSILGVAGLSRLIMAIYHFKNYYFIKNFSASNLKDRSKVYLCGIIRAINEPLISPVTKSRCVFYNYDSFYYTHQSNQEKSKRHSSYVGFHLTPSVISTNIGEFKILSYPTLNIFKSLQYSYSSNPNYYQNLKDYCANANFTILDLGITNILDAVKTSINKTIDVMQDKDGDIRSDTKTNDNRNIEDNLLSELIIPNETEITLTGIYNKEKNGIISSLDSMLNIFKGDKQETLKKEMQSAIVAILLCIIFFALPIFVTGMFYLCSTNQIKCTSIGSNTFFKKTNSSLNSSDNYR